MYLPVFKEWPYVGDVLWSPETQHSSSPELGAPKVSPMWTHAPYCCGEAITAIGMLSARVIVLLTARPGRGTRLLGSQ